MTQDKARRRALDAACKQAISAPGFCTDAEIMALAIREYERVMGVAGWRMQPIVGECGPRLQRPYHSDTSAAILAPDDGDG